MLLAQSGLQTTMMLNSGEMETILQALMHASQELIQKKVPDLYFGPLAEEIFQKWKPNLGDLSGPMGTL